MKIQNNYNLSKLNTFGILAKAKFFVEINNETDLKELFDIGEFKNNEKLFLGGGSNVLFTKDFDGLVIFNKLKGIEILKEDSKNVLIKSMGGEMWHDIVIFSVERNLWGIENLAFVPGTVGAAPIQNIGAYGVELKDTLENVEVFDIETGEKKVLDKEECKFGYRDSVFKNELKGKYFITAITLKLSKTPARQLAGGENKKKIYPALEKYLVENKIEIKNSKDISDAVTAIRKSKLPNPEVIPNAGSFFKNVFVKEIEFKKLQKTYPNIPFFKENGEIKIPSGWLIEQCGPANGTSWKGYRLGNVGVHDKQALVLVNYGGATGEKVLNLANKIIANVKEKFGLKLTPEVNLI
ncbi:UDP-N-acetylenolpyruvoylglucosamine reductase [Candidatus Nomurabacteria bacterium RIFOXYC2_FULL_36_19]|uniref:UDP-N-acetylenolpyruvoylglucosamine reductase n=2 Tax=Candidatus Nomuraibacteriota TaxID=1752729 RepID=A0A1F6YT47_9BACT|nr:MAG: UDP-N-acetylenolpyruvoylglucosamine reductase [Candidatus Nomurabacteria bacterium RIFOXYA2_FULL_35_9]OGJ06873.1 MAG: UDP-N-acetylenolpyruvoylglucosamine reductase [Candidatus Nomurabacteria bacterium RIFOXYA1_FULL_35_17]OGJ09480.1 MAG: UDP-N-acetylenolpyruvoylglucosamine reductase [Candidatus Nomurabacteria bacterium RIFOXYC2_FULL_36_19]OGJ14831.1 MAG: UDP-N-acetylenolpyruvoylglucosamine reductase [Candidatus Nomurabacteria bacterium RIFOXYD2_FULL_35_12]